METSGQVASALLALGADPDGGASQRAAEAPCSIQMCMCATYRVCITLVGVRGEIMIISQKHEKREGVSVSSYHERSHQLRPHW
jgi:hypothetical protein